MPFGYIPQSMTWKDLVYRLLGWPNAVRRLQAPVVMRMLDPAKDDLVLDAGCGGGNFAFETARDAKRCIGVDTKLSQKASSALAPFPRVSLVIGDVQRLPLKEGRIDKVLLSSVVQMVERDRDLLRECNRVTRKGGILVLSVPVDYIWVRRLNAIREDLKLRFGSMGKGYYGLEEIGALLSDAGYQVVEQEYAPKKWGSLVYELWLFVCCVLRLSLSSPYYFLFLYPLASFDKIVGLRCQKGNEIVIKAVKAA